MTSTSISSLVGTVPLWTKILDNWRARVSQVDTWWTINFQQQLMIWPRQSEGADALLEYAGVKDSAWLTKVQLSEVKHPVILVIFLWFFFQPMEINSRLV